ncbi:leucyl aminopeptidase [Phytohabitans aurantiacus]|uniref:Probable cytosol aminopeptidase n=1 Tax=Phytohabitans aurantiacus TaxID=3016789 RepID=A0ABQ5R045_9ACTN|nr:leucyl aminopeptidase [Phytohabitans aurantiacus]GLI00182.1 putative cytosol aminopeptidase [Phytohabitans aurantiacus]
MTALTVSTTPTHADCVVIGIAQGPHGPVLAPGAADFDGTLIELLRTVGVTGAEGEAVKLPAPAGSGARLVLAVGLGAAGDDGYDVEALRRAAGVAARTLAGARRVTVALPAGTAEAVEAVATGGLLGAYTFGSYRTGDRAAAPVRELAILAGRDGQAAAEAAVRRAGVLGQEVNRARDLVNTPANDLYPESFADVVASAGREYGLAVEVLDERALAAGGFGGILGVGQGSVRPPRLVRIAHTHPEATASLAFVGKGITYDSGGISLKPVGANEIMKRDMSGAAAVFAAVVAAARLGLRVNVTGWLAMAENMPSGSALRPGDVLRVYGGRTVEVLNTDAEGRLVLADALVRAGEERPDAIVDVATLTAAMRFGLGNHLFGVMSNDDAFRDRVVDAAARAGERAWPMPLPKELRKSLNSRVADIANYGERMGGGLVAGLFLQEFVPAGIPWAHLDIAGPAFHEGEPYGYTPNGGTGCAVRTLVQTAQDAVR